MRVTTWTTSSSTDLSPCRGGKGARGVLDRRDVLDLILGRSRMRGGRGEATNYCRPAPSFIFGGLIFRPSCYTQPSVRRFFQQQKNGLIDAAENHKSALTMTKYRHWHTSTWWPQTPVLCYKTSEKIQRHRRRRTITPVQLLTSLY